MGALKGDVGKIKTLRSRLRELPRTLAASVAVKAAPALTDLAQGAFDSGRSVYGDARPAGVDGEALSLRKTGAAESVIRFEAVGTVVRTPVFPRYMRYLISRFSVLPGGNAAIPAAWKQSVDQIVHETKAPLE